MDAFFEPVANSLGAAAQRVERNAQALGEREPAVYLLAFLIAVILQDQSPALRRQFFQALFEAILSFIILHRFGRDERSMRFNR